MLQLIKKIFLSCVLFLSWTVLKTPKAEVSKINSKPSTSSTEPAKAKPLAKKPKLEVKAGDSKQSPQRSLAGTNKQKVQELAIKGNKLIKTELIESHIQLKKGQIYSPQKANQDIKKLFSLGFFEDIQIERSYKGSQLKLIYHFKERELISTITFEGNKKLNDEEIEEISLLEEYQFLDPDKLQKTLTALKKKYEEKAYYLMAVDYEIKKDPKNKNGNPLVIRINENFKLFIQSIHFIGNRNIPSRRLKRFMKNKERNILSFLGTGGIYQAEFIDQDLQLLEYYYRDQGYLDVRIQQPEISITANKKSLSLYFKISEGPRYKVGKLYFEGDDIVSQEQVQAHFSLAKKEYFSLRALQEDLQKIALLYKNKGYAFVEVKPLFQSSPLEENKISIFFEVHKGDPYKIRQINISGNKLARDRVILRRLRIQEGQLYKQSQIDLSRQLLEQLAIFEKVEFSPQRVPTESLDKRDSLSDTTKSLDLNAHVTERDNTGEFNLAGGWNSRTKLYFSGGLKKNNFLGLDQNIGFKVNMGFYDESLVFNYQNSYVFDTKWNFMFDAFNTANQQFTGSSVGSGLGSLFFGQDYLTYFTLSTGFAFSLGRYLNNFSNLFVKYKFSNEVLGDKPQYFLRSLPIISNIFGKIQEDLEKDSSLDKSFTDANLKLPLEDLHLLRWTDIYDFKSATGLDSSLSLIWEYDKRNDRFYASKGFLTRLSLEYSGFPGNFDYTKMEGLFRHYYRPFWKFVVKNRLEWGWVFSNDTNKDVPFTQLFLLGGPYDLRGFVINSQGPKKRSQKAFDYAKARNEMIANGESQYEPIASIEDFSMRPYGGNQKLLYTLELEFPIFEKMGLRGAGFVDLGEVNEGFLKFNLKDQFRANAGVGLRWRSPFGPLSLDWAFPYKPRKQYYENSWEFQFSIGSQL